MQNGTILRKALPITRASVLEASSINRNVGCRSRSSTVAQRQRSNQSSRSHQSRNSREGRDKSDYRVLLSFSLLPSLYMLLPESLRREGSNPDLSPYQYTRHTVRSVERLGPQHLLLRIDLNDESRAMFSVDEQDLEAVTIQHVCVKSPDLQIERPYTPINDPARDGYMEFVVKRVRGGEVGRYIHSMEAGDEIELRGPIMTSRIPLQGLSEVDLISTGTGIAPFMQLLNKLGSRQEVSGSTSVAASKGSTPVFNLYQCEPRDGDLDLAEVAQFFPALRKASVGDVVDGIEPIASKLGAGPRVRFKRYRANVGATIPVDWNSILLAKSDGTQELSKTIESEDKSSWWSSLWNGTSPTAEASSPAEQVSKVNPTRGAMMCLPKTMADSLVGRDYPITLRRKDAPLGGILGELGYAKDRVWVL